MGLASELKPCTSYQLLNPTDHDRLQGPRDWLTGNPAEVLRLTSYDRLQKAGHARSLGKPSTYSVCTPAEHEFFSHLEHVMMSLKTEAVCMMMSLVSSTVSRRRPHMRLLELQHSATCTIILYRLYPGSCILLRDLCTGLHMAHLTILS